MADVKSRREPTPNHLIQAQLAAYASGLRGEELADATRRLYEPDAVDDWSLGVREGRNPKDG
jgi:hypothetical protein